MTYFSSVLKPYKHDVFHQDSVNYRYVIEPLISNTRSEQEATWWLDGSQYSQIHRVSTSVKDDVLDF